MSEEKIISEVTQELNNEEHSIYFRSSNGSVCTERVSDFGQEDELERNYYMCNFDASDGIYQ